MRRCISLTDRVLGAIDSSYYDSELTTRHALHEASTAASGTHVETCSLQTLLHKLVLPTCASQSTLLRKQALSVYY